MEVYDTAKRQDPLSSSIEQAYRSFSFLESQDSSMLFFSQYDAIKRKNIGIQDLGDIGTPYREQLFTPNKTTGFISGLNPFGDIYFSSNTAKLYNAKLPYTEFKYAQGRAGTRGLINFDALHTQNFGKRSGISLKYHSVAYDGFYKNQTTINKNLHTNFYYKSKNERYLALIFVSWNKSNLKMNGGISRDPETDTLFRRLGPNVRFVNVLLNNSKNINRLAEYRFKQSYTLIKGKDSTHSLNIGHDFTYLKQSNYYTNTAADFGFFDSTYYFNKSLTADSLLYRSYSNSIELFTPLQATGISFKSGLQYDNISFLSRANEGNYSLMRGHNLSIYSAFNFAFLNRFQSSASGRLYLNGYNAGDYLIEWNNKTQISKSQRLNLSADLSISQRQASYIQSQLFTNHYLYNNNFDPTAYKTISVSIDRNMKRPSVYNAYYYSIPEKQYGIKVQYLLIDNYLYAGENAIPTQGASGQNCLQTELYAHINLKKIQLHQELAYQTFSNNLKQSVQLPSLMSKSSVYFQSYAFKKSGFFQIGFDANISSSYKASIYNPATLQWQISDYNVGAYPFLDFFINAEVKTARIFFKMEHINMDLPNTRYYDNYLFVSPFHPASPRRFRLGFAWKFYY
jgi:hypothetical protein